MGRTVTMRRQHDAAEELVAEIRAALDGAGPSELQPYAIGLRLAKLTGLLRIHLAQQHRMLYPQMVNSAHAGTPQSAPLFQRELGELGPDYPAFAERWSSVRAIAADFGVFCHEAQGVFAALAERMQREETLFDPLADAVVSEQERCDA